MLRSALGVATGGAERSAAPVDAAEPHDMAHADGPQLDGILDGANTARMSSLVR